MELDRRTLEPLSCWFSVDRVKDQPEVTDFKRETRLRQARWRKQQGHRMGWHRSDENPIANGSRLHPVDAGLGFNFLSDSIRQAVRDRLHSRQKGQQLNAKRLREDLLSSMPMCFNLFGELHGDPRAIAKAGRALWDIDGGDVGELIFEWSPNRHAREYTGDGTAFDAAFIFGDQSSPRTIVGVETKYHEHAVLEATPNATTRLPRYREITERSGIFASNWEKKILGTSLQQIWRDHLLVLAMLEQPDRWRAGKYVLVYPARNKSFREVGSAYRSLLKDDSTFCAVTIEELLGTKVLHRAGTAKAFEQRYIW